MEKPNKKWASLGLLSIIIPITLLVTFRLTGLQPEPQTPVTVTVKEVSWNVTRPTIYPKYFIIDEQVENSYVDDISADLTARVVDYRENVPGYWLWEGGYDEIDVRIVLTANVSEGFIHSVVIKLSEIDAQADVIIIDDEDWIQVQNLKIDMLDDFSQQNEAWVKAASINQPKDVGLHITAFWTFFDLNNMDHWITATAEVTYFNGSTWKSVVIPLRLGVLVS